MPRERIAIAGAGIAGLTAALALAQRGFPVTVLERSPVLEEVGAGLQLSPNAMGVLTSLGLGPALATQLVEPEAILVRRARDGRQIVRMSLRHAAERWGAPYAVIHRADLQEILFEAATRSESIALALGTEVTGVETEPEGLAVLADRGGTGVGLKAEALIGADGLWSKVRPLMGLEDPPAFSGKRAWRAT